MKTKALGLVLSLVLTACGGDDPQQQSSAAASAAAPPTASNTSLSIENQKMTPEAQESASDATSVSTPLPTAENSVIATNFCYAVHAVGNCEGLIMRMDTRDKVEEIIGDPHLGTPQSLYTDACLDGLIKAQEDKNLCRNAWENFGCGGKKTPNLIQQSPFSNSNPILCQFRG